MAVARNVFRSVPMWLFLTFSAFPASAADFEFLYPSTDAQMGKISKTGFIINPDIDYSKLSFAGNGSSQLKDAKGFRAGVELGYDYQIGDVVFGVLGSISYADIKGKQNSGGATALRTDMDYFASISGRIGYTFDRWMVYGTTGLAFAGLEVENRALNLKSNQDLTGWLAGGGVEYAYNRSVTIRGEYTRVDLSEEKFSSLPGSRKDIGGTMDLIKIGVIRRF